MIAKNEPLCLHQTFNFMHLTDELGFYAYMSLSTFSFYKTTHMQIFLGKIYFHGISKEEMKQSELKWSVTMTKKNFTFELKVPHKTSCIMKLML